MKKHHTTIVWLLSLALVAGLLLLLEHELLWKAQETNLFLGSMDFLRQQMVTAGGLLSWAGSWFTQFFFYPWAGVAMLIAWWLLLMWLTKHAFRIPDRWAMLLLVPVALLLITLVDIGYWIYVLKLQGHFFVATIGTTAVAALLWGYRCIPQKYYLRTVFIVASCAVGYPLLGVYGLTATLLMGIWSWKLNKGAAWRALGDCMVAILCTLIVPLLCYRYVYYQTSLSDIYRMGLPLYTVAESHPSYYIPFCLLALFYVALTLFEVKDKELKNRTWMGTQALLLVAIIAGVLTSWYKDENFHRELSMQHCIARLDWQGVIEEAAAQKDEPTRAIVMMRNLALARMGRQGNEMYRYKNGSKKSNAPFTMRMMIVAGPLVYYHYGMSNYCIRLCTEMGVEYGWKAEQLKYIARCAILNGENQLARKYLGILKQTLFFGKWAENVERMIGDEDALRKHPETGFICHMMHYDNTLTSDQGFTERFLMQQLSNSTYTVSPVFQEQTLVASLWTRDVEMFWQHLIDYIKLHPDDDLPIHYQEAAILYGSIEGRKDLDSWPFAESVRESYRLFREVTPRYQNKEVDAVRKALYPLFGNTFYYDYYLMNNLPQW